MKTWVALSLILFSETQKLLRKGVEKMVNNNLRKFLKSEKKARRDYLQGTQDNEKGASSSAEYNNNNNDTDISPGAEGRNS